MLYIRKACIGLARAEMHTGALDWFNCPIVELLEWAEAVEAIEKSNKKRK